MIKSEGYKAFRGMLIITPKNGKPPFSVYGDWLYHPAVNCWYGNGRSFSADVCKVALDETERDCIDVFVNELNSKINKTFNTMTAAKIKALIKEVRGKGMRG